MYNSDLAYQRYQHALNQARRTQIPVPYDLDSPVTHTLHDTRDPWNIQQASMVKGIDLDGNEIDCHPDSLAAFKKQCSDYIVSTKPMDLPTRYFESKKAVNELTLDIVSDHRRLNETSADTLIENVEACATALVMDSLEVIKSKLTLSAPAELHILQVLNDVVELTAHTVNEFEGVFDAIGLLKDDPHIVVEAFEEAGKELDAYITKLWGDINT